MRTPLPHTSLPIFLMVLLALCGLTACSTVPEPMAQVTMPPEYRENSNERESLPETQAETEHPGEGERQADLEPTLEPEGLRLMFNDRILRVEDLGDLPENSTLLIIAPKNTSHREVTDLLLKVHGAGHLIELRSED